MIGAGGGVVVLNEAARDKCEPVEVPLWVGVPIVSLLSFVIVVILVAIIRDEIQWRRRTKGWWR